MTKTDGVDEKQTVVTAVAKGIDFGIAAAVGRRGDTVLVFDTYDEALSRSTSRLASASIDAVGLPVDVTSGESVTGTIGATVAKSR